LTRDEEADADLQELIRQFQSSDTSHHDPPKTLFSTLSSDTTSDAPSSQHDTHLDGIHPSTLAPKTMSCKDAFDYAFFCQSIGGQWVNVYRYGELRSCSEHWDNFWTCMRSRSYPKGEREKMIQEHYQKKLNRWKMGPSSEDVWEMRMERLPEEPFMGDLKAAETKLAEERGKTG